MIRYTDMDSPLSCFFYINMLLCWPIITSPNIQTMNNSWILFISLVFAAVCCAANPVKLQNNPLGIINGTYAKDGEFPYVVQVTGDKVFVCGGAIIDKTWILTSAQCTGTFPDTIVYGTNVLDQAYPVNTTVRIKRTVVHPKFIRDPEIIPLYDVAVIELEESIQFNDKVQRLKLAENNDVPFHVPGTLTGWGLNTSNAQVMSTTLRKVELPLLNDSECFNSIKSRYGADAFNSVHHICSDNQRGSQCSGDLGNPFVINGLGYGIVSWTYKPCGSSPGVYTRITSPEYRDFIRNVTGV